MSVWARLFLVFAVGGCACAQTPASALPETASLAPAQATPGAATIIASSPTDTRDLLPELPAIPKGSVTLIGGTIHSLDRVRDRIIVQVFGGAKAVVSFDPRTRVYHNGVVASPVDLQAGQRIYVDTMLDGTDIFAKNIRIVGQGSMGQGGGQIVEHAPGSAILTVRDVLSPEPLRLHLDASSVVTRNSRPVSADELVPGTLVSMDFSPDEKGHAVVRQISILAVPGSTFYFGGRVAHLDLSQGSLVVVDPRDQRSYEVHCDPPLLRAHPDLHEGVDVTVTTSFDGSQYTAKAITLNPASPR